MTIDEQISYLSKGMAEIFLIGDMPVVPLPEGITRDSAIRVDKLLARVGRAESVSDGARKIKAGAVEINGERIEDVTIGNSSFELVTQVGKKWCRVLTGRP